MNKKILQNYAKLLINLGVNLNKGDDLVIDTTFDGLPLAKQVALYAYSCGAKEVDFVLADEELTKLKLMNEDCETLTHIAPWKIAQKDYIVDRKACYLLILSEDPKAYQNINAELLANITRAKDKAFKKYYTAVTTNQIRWCICAVPNKKWAKTIFPQLPAKQAIEQLWQLIVTTMSLDQPDPFKCWQDHIVKLQKRSDFMTNAQFCKLKFSNSLGTDLTIGLPKDYYFSGGYEQSKDGIGFTANMPTQEIFTLPHAKTANGKIVASMPLVHNGAIIDNFWMQLKDGRIVDYDAEQGLDILKGIIESDEGSHYLGEIALVEYNSPIQMLNTLFYNTLFDENASCHFAIGEAYPMIKNIDKLSEQEKCDLGVNKSCQHVDFMIGSPDLSIVGIKDDGTQIDIFVNGNFVC